MFWSVIVLCVFIAIAALVLGAPIFMDLFHRDDI